MSVEVMTESETQFVEYLRSRGLDEPQRHPALKGNRKGKRPDFGLTLGGVQFFFEVKEFADRNIPESGPFSLYAPIYNKIEEALDQFDEYSDHPCCLVLYSRDASFIHLDTTAVFGSALSDLCRGLLPSPQATITMAIPFGTYQRDGIGSIISKCNQGIHIWLP